MIYTFYSYKGGVGRSMALANVAVCLYRRGARVLVIDWDLEAPGLENFFFDSENQVQEVKSQFGVIDMLLDYKRQYSLVASVPALNQELAGSKSQSGARNSPFDQIAPYLLPLRSLVYPIYPPESPNDKKSRALWLLPSGWRSTGRKPGGDGQTSTASKDDRFSKYAEAVQSFDWAEFYSHFDGESFFNWLRDQLLPFPSSPFGLENSTTERLGPDVVLIDSRTGVTEMGGVCTRQLADVIVSFCAPNYQNLDGVARMSESFVREDLRKFRGGRLPEVVVVPARVDLQGETTEQNRFQSLFEERLRNPLAFEQVGLKMWDLLIPYVTKYAYREALTVGVADSNKRLEKAYIDLTASLVLLSDPESNLQTYFARDMMTLKLESVTFPQGTSPVQDPANVFASLFAGFTADEVLAARRVLTSLVNVSSNTRLVRKIEDIGAADRAILDRLVASSLVKRSTSKTGDVVELAHDALIQHWPQLREWLEEDREFLLWRQRLDSALTAWKETDKDPEALLPRSLTEQAASRLRERREYLTREEIEFIEASQQKSKGLVERFWTLARGPSFRTMASGSFGAFTVLFLQRFSKSSGLSAFSESYLFLALAISLAAGVFTFVFQGRDKEPQLFKAFFLGASFPLFLGLLTTSAEK